MTEPTLLPKAPLVKTPRLTLRPFRDTDMDAVIELVCSREIAKTFMLPELDSREQAEQLFRTLQRLSQDEGHFVYGVCLDDRPIGLLNDVAIENTSIELGYCIHPLQKNQGFATEVLAAAIRELFRMDYCQIRAGFFEENTASRRVMEKCGMQPCGHTETIEYRGVSHRCIYYSIHR